MSLSNQILYFAIGDYNTKNEYGHYLTEDDSISENDKNYIKTQADNKIKSFAEKDLSSKDYTILDTNNYILFYSITSSGIFYIAISSLQSIYTDKNNLMYELFEDIEHQGLKKLVDPKTGTLNRVGLQNLKFSIEQHNSKMKGQNGNKEGNKITELNNQINDLNLDVKNSVKNMIVNVNEMKYLDNKSSDIRESSEKFQQGSLEIERKMKRNCYVKIGLGILGIVICYIVVKMIFI